MNEKCPPHQHIEPPLLDHSACDFFRRADTHYVASLESWAQRRRVLEALLPDRLRDVSLSPDEQSFLARVEIERLTYYMGVEEGEDLPLWDHFAIWISNQLLSRAEWADTASFAERHHFVLTLGASYDGWGTDDRTRQALTLAHGWYGARVHGVTLLLPDDFLERNKGAQLHAIEQGVNLR